MFARLIFSFDNINHIFEKKNHNEPKPLEELMDLQKKKNSYYSITWKGHQKPSS